MKWRYVAIILGLFVAVIAVTTLHHLLVEVKLHDVITQFKSTSWQSISVGILLVTINYFILTGYDVLALKHLGKKVPYLKSALASFTSYTVSHNLGLSFLTGGSVRYRIYSICGLSAVEISSLILICSLTFWLGVLVLLSLVFLIEPKVLSITDSLPLLFNQIIGVLLIIITITYLILSFLHKSFIFRNWSIQIPSLNISLKQIGLGVIDISLAAGALYVLFPANIEIGFFEVLGIYIAAISLGFLSHSPGGLGVFEAIMLLGLPQIDKGILLGTLLMYRCLYYFLPLSIGLFLLSFHEVHQRKQALEKLSKSFKNLGGILAPRFIGTAVFIGGAILLFSGAMPPAHDRLLLLKPIISLPFIETSHLMASVIGLWLLFLARGILLRLDSAWVLTVILLIVGIVTSLLKGLDYEEALILSVILLTLLANRSAFYRKGSLLHQPLTAEWLFIVPVILAITLWLGLFAYKHIEYSDVLWWQFSYQDSAPRFMRTSVVVIVLGLSWLAYGLLRPLKPMPVKTISDIDHIIKIINTSSFCNANLALTGDKRLLFSEDGTAFLMYEIQGRSWIVMGNPVGPVEQWEALLSQFRQLVDLHAGWPVFYQVDTDSLPFYLDQGLAIFKVGEEGVIPLADFTLEGSKNSELRYINRKLSKQGLEFFVVQSSNVRKLIPELQVISDQWMHLKSTKEKGFSVGFFDPDYIARCDVAIIKKESEIIAFANLWKTNDKTELSVDMMRYLPESPNGVMDYLFIQLMLWGQQQAYHNFTMGMSPLAGFQNDLLTPIWMRIGEFIFRHGEHFYNFEGLRAYKNKFNPEWHSRYIACPGGIKLPRLLLDIAALIAGGPTKIFGK